MNISIGVKWQLWRGLAFLPWLFQAFFNPGLYPGEQIISFQIGTWFVVWKKSALLWTGTMDRTPFDHFILWLENAGSIVFYFESRPVFHIALAYFAVRNWKMTWQTVNVIRIYQQYRAFKPVAAISWTVITVIHMGTMYIVTYSLAGLFISVTDNWLSYPVDSRLQVGIFALRAASGPVVLFSLIKLETTIQAYIRYSSQLFTVAF